MTRVAVWSGPRNISTALLRAWENRPDTTVVDEPLYAHFLAVSGRDDPGRAEILRTGDTDWRRVVARLTGPVPAGAAVFYQKHMAHHLTPDIDRGWITGLTNVLLIRDPAEVVASYVRSRPDVVPADLGYDRQVALYHELAAAGRPPPVIDAADFLQDPRGHLAALCTLAGVEFLESMLSWPAGPRSTDGVWGPYWYAAVWESTGFSPYQPRGVHLCGAPARVAAECGPAYEWLRAHRFTG